MPNQLALTIGNTTVAVALPRLTNQQALAVLTRYALVKGIDTNGLTPAQLGEAVLKRMLREVRDASLDRQRQELESAHRATIDATLNADNDLFDDQPTGANP